MSTIYVKQNFDNVLSHTWDLCYGTLNMIALNKLYPYLYLKKLTSFDINAVITILLSFDKNNA